MRTQVTFRLTSDHGGSAADVSTRLGVSPTSGYEAGGPVGSRTSSPREHSSWHLSSDRDPQDGLELATALNVVLDALEPVGPALWQLIRDGYSANWFCYVGSHATEHAVELDRETLKRLVQLPGDLWLDVYPDDDDTDERSA
ncbi:MAG: hypothetical protein QOG52_1252 [Frankiaceae bacterium]|jgi:hypothetical protein|nr:hypothetical protein [Frankiaceae bacterium]